MCRGTFGRVAGIYNRFQYVDEMRDALTTWESHVLSLVDGKPRYSASIWVRPRRLILIVAPQAYASTGELEMYEKK